jgi:hypothetical protein
MWGGLYAITVRRVDRERITHKTSHKAVATHRKNSNAKKERIFRVTCVNVTHTRDVTCNQI